VGKNIPKHINENDASVGFMTDECTPIVKRLIAFLCCGMPEPMEASGFFFDLIELDNMSCSCYGNICQ
jgi:hypothetical protein